MNRSKLIAGSNTSSLSDKPQELKCPPNTKRENSLTAEEVEETTSVEFKVESKILPKQIHALNALNTTMDSLKPPEKAGGKGEGGESRVEKDEAEEAAMDEDDESKEKMEKGTEPELKVNPEENNCPEMNIVLEMQCNSDKNSLGKSNSEIKTNLEKNSDLEMRPEQENIELVGETEFKNKSEIENNSEIENKLDAEKRSSDNNVNLEKAELEKNDNLKETSGKTNRNALELKDVIKTEKEETKEYDEHVKQNDDEVKGDAKKLDIKKEILHKEEIENEATNQSGTSKQDLKFSLANESNPYGKDSFETKAINVKESKSAAANNFAPVTGDYKPFGEEPKLFSEDKPKVELEVSKNETVDSISVIKEIEKFEDEKADNESVTSDVSKGMSTDVKDDPLDSKEDSDYWSAKEVNIDSVIKKVDALCSADELSDRSSEIEKDEWYDNDMKVEEKKDEESAGEEMEESKTVATRQMTRRGGRGARGRKVKAAERTGVQTRRGKAIKEPQVSAKRGRGGRPKSDRKTAKVEETQSDVYEFKDDSEENNVSKDRPRLILTIKPALVGTQPQAIVKSEIKAETEDFTPPVTNTRKSRRLQEKDVSRNTVDDTIEDVVKNTMVTRSASANQGQNTRRSTRQAATKIPVVETPKKSPRGRKKDRRASETTDDSSEEKSVCKPEITLAKVEEVETTPVKEIQKEQVAEVKHEAPPPPVVKEKPHEGLKAAMLRRVKGEMAQEPMTLIDPETGILTPMRECEEGKYIPVSGNAQGTQPSGENAAPSNKTEQSPAIPQPIKQSIKSLKAHVLSSHAAKEVATQQSPKPLAVTQPQLISKSSAAVPICQSLNVNVSLPNFIPAHLSPRPVLPQNLGKGVKTTPPPLSPNQLAAIQKQQQMQLKQGKVSHLTGHMPSQVMTSPMAASVKSQGVKPQLVIAKGPMVKPHGLHQQQQILTGAVASPPLKQPHLSQQPMVAGANPSRLMQAMDPPKVEVSMAGCVMVPRSNVSPQGQTRQHVLQSGMPVPAYEASLVSCLSIESEICLEFLFYFPNAIGK